jgi:hypothetical protein
MKMEALLSFETTVSMCPVTQCQISDWLQLRYKGQSDNAGQGNTRCLLLRSRDTQRAGVIVRFGVLSQVVLVVASGL